MLPAPRAAGRADWCALWLRWSRGQRARGARGQLRHAEEEGDLARGRLGCIRAMHDVALDAGGEVGADRAGSGLLRVGRTHDIAVADDGILALQHLDDDG